MRYVKCEEDGFRVESRDKKEIADILKAHMMKMHGIPISDREAAKKVMNL